MEHAFVLLAIIGGVTHVTGNQCKETNGNLECPVPAGETLYVQMMNDLRGHQVICQKEIPRGQNANVFTVKKEKFTVQYEAFRDRTEFFTHNGTFKISNLQHNDSGHYVTEVFDPNGLRVRTINMQVHVLENSSPFWILVAAGVVALLILLLCICCCVCRCKKKSGSTTI